MRGREIRLLGWKSGASPKLSQILKVLRVML